MPRYIDATEAVDEILRIPQEDYICFDDETGESLITTDSAIIAIENCKTADVEEVRHERWEPYLVLDDLRSNYFRCTGCKRIEEIPRGLNVNEWKPYCHCGAKMDAEEEE